MYLILAPSDVMKHKQVPGFQILRDTVFIIFMYCETNLWLQFFF